MSFSAPYFPRNQKDLERSKNETQRFPSLFNTDIKVLKYPQDIKGDEFIVGRILPPTWNALDPYGPPLRPGKDKITREMFPTSPFFKVSQYFGIGPSKSQFLSSGEMLYEMSGPGSERAAELYKELGGDFIYEYKNSLVDEQEQKAYRPKVSYYAYFLDRKNGNELKLLKLPITVYQSFLASAVDVDTNEPLPYDAWDESGFDVQLMLCKKSFGEGQKPNVYVDKVQLVSSRKGRPCLPTSDEIEALQQRLYAKPLPSIMNFTSAEEMKKKLGLDAVGGGSRREDDDGEDSTVSWGSKTKPSKKSAVKTEGLVEDDDSEGLEDFKPASVPTRNTKATKSVQDEEDEEEEVEEVRPAAKRASTVARESVSKKLPDAFEDEDEDPNPPAASVEDDEEDVPAKAPVGKAGAKSAKKQPLFEDEEEEAEEPTSKAPAKSSKSATKAQAAPAKASKKDSPKAESSKTPPRLESAFEDDEDE